jgi:hypothetical protein
VARGGSGRLPEERPGLPSGKLPRRPIGKDLFGSEIQSIKEDIGKFAGCGGEAAPSSRRKPRQAGWPQRLEETLGGWRRPVASAAWVSLGPAFRRCRNRFPLANLPTNRPTYQSGNRVNPLIWDFSRICGPWSDSVPLKKDYEKLELGGTKGPEAINPGSIGRKRLKFMEKTH